MGGGGAAERETESADVGSAGTAVVLFGQGGQCTVVRGQFWIFVFVLVAGRGHGHRVGPRRWSSRSRGCCRDGLLTGVIGHVGRQIVRHTVVLSPDSRF